MAESNDNKSLFPDNLFLDTTREDIEASGLDVTSGRDTWDGTEVLFVSLPGSVSSAIRVTENGRLYACNEHDLKILKASLGVES